ncbi:hypothetical protein vBCbaSRXM_29 [Citromicrobium phage vB_CbaS-RXM]|nr:hypothetical protein vBCbaSRXM_29 [Citromicrobium phage vB_CbaS-RXM]
MADRPTRPKLRTLRKLIVETGVKLSVAEERVIAAMTDEFYAPAPTLGFKRRQGAVANSLVAKGIAYRRPGRTTADPHEFQLTPFGAFVRHWRDCGELPS